MKRRYAVAGGARGLRCRVIYPTGCCVCASVFSMGAQHSDTRPHTSVSPVSFVILPYRRFLSLSLSRSPSQSVPSSSSSRSLFLLHSLTTHGADSTRSRERDVSAALRVSPRSRRRFRRNKPRSMGRLVGYDPGYMMVARRARRGMP